MKKKNKFNLFMAIMMLMLSVSFVSNADNTKKGVQTNMQEKEKTKTNHKVINANIHRVKLVLPNKKEILSVPAVITNDTFLTPSNEILVELGNLLVEKKNNEFNKKIQEYAKVEKAGLIKKDSVIYVTAENDYAVEFYVDDLDYPLYVFKDFVKAKSIK